MSSSVKSVHKLDETAVVNQTRLPFILYLIYLVSFFTRIPARLPILGFIRFDLLLVFLIGCLIFSARRSGTLRLDNASKYLLAIFIYSILTLPLVEWPGSVINNGMVAFIKGAIFYFFTVNLVINIDRLKWILVVFVVCNLIRIFEPLLMNLTTGYLGSTTHLGSGEFAGRLSGAPFDTINPNGLAFVIATVIPFLHYVFAPTNKKTFLVYLLLIPVLLYTMGLTLSRSGVLALAIIAFGVWLKSAHKFLLLVLAIGGLAIIFLNLSDVQKDRYLSIVSDDARQSASADGRIEGWFIDFKVAMNRPLIGHGLGTSREANWNVTGKDQVSHILWAEVWQEIGFIGLLLFMLYLKTMIVNFKEASGLIKSHLGTADFLFRCSQAMQVWLLMNLLFSLASYGLKSYEWYFFGGLSVALLKITKESINKCFVSAERDCKDSNSSDERFILARKIR